MLCDAGLARRPCRRGRRRSIRAGTLLSPEQHPGRPHGAPSRCARSRTAGSTAHRREADAGAGGGARRRARQHDLLADAAGDPRGLPAGGTLGARRVRAGGRGHRADRRRRPLRGDRRRGRRARPVPARRRRRRGAALAGVTVDP